MCNVYISTFAIVLSELSVDLFDSLSGTSVGRDLPISRPLHLTSPSAPLKVVPLSLRIPAIR